MIASYAGVYIPYYTQYMLSKGVKVDGVAIGNGWMHPAIQYESIYKYIKQHDLLPQKFLPDLETVHQDCKKSTSNPDTVFQFDAVCEGLFDLLWIAANDTQ